MLTTFINPSYQTPSILLLRQLMLLNKTIDRTILDTLPDLSTAQIVGCTLQALWSAH
jgi:hypothetical protein